MAGEPSVKRTCVFIDGQNLFHAAKEAFGYSYPNYDAARLADRVCEQQGWRLVQTCFYTGIPDAADDPFWNHFWTAKLAAMGRQGIRVFSRPLRYNNQTVRIEGGATHTFLVGQEKGIDVRIGLDIVRSVRQDICDVAVVFSQDEDLSEVADEVRALAREHGRWVKMASAFPDSPTRHYRRGVNKTDWIRIDRALYDACLDLADYRPRRTTHSARWIVVARPSGLGCTARICIARCASSAWPRRRSGNDRGGARLASDPRRASPARGAERPAHRPTGRPRRRIAR